MLTYTAKILIRVIHARRKAGASKKSIDGWITHLEQKEYWQSETIVAVREYVRRIIQRKEVTQ